MNKDIYLISLETGGNQAYIFATNKLRNIVGASELLYRVGTSYVKRALEKINANYYKKDEDSVKNDPDKYAIENNAELDFEIIISTSGKALLLARGRERAKEFITEWSKIVMSEASGVDAVAVCSNTPVNLALKLNDKSPNSYMQVFRETEKQMTLLRIHEGMPLSRFQRLPIVTECVFSGLPASDIDAEGRPVSVSCSAQREAAGDDEFKERIEMLFPDKKSAAKCLKGLNSLEGLGWLAVIHADGNGLGQLFINFADHVKAIVGSDKADGRNYINYYRKFSKALDEISKKAFQNAVEDIWGYGQPYIFPVVVGGDDLTVVMDGYDSIEFVRRFMEFFCSETATLEDNDTKQILEKAGLPQLGMCAGISIAKPHFPFSQSYSLAEELMKNAKLVKTQYGPDSIALDFHILYDSIATSISDIRSKLKIGDRVLTEKPYVIHEGTSREKLSEEWAEFHKFVKFTLAVEAVKKLPSSQAHAVRDDLFSEMRTTQEAEWKFLLNTYDKFAEEWEKVQKDRCLYSDIKNKDGKIEYHTCYLDALEAMKFWKDNEGGANK